MSHWELQKSQTLSRANQICVWIHCCFDSSVQHARGHFFFHLLLVLNQWMLKVHCSQYRWVFCVVNCWSITTDHFCANMALHCLDGLIVKFPKWAHFVLWHWYKILKLLSGHTSGAVWELRWTSWAVHPNEPFGFCGCEDLLKNASALVSACP